jgi:hypothetical protein
MLKNQRQNLIMENEFHIKEERVKAQQSSSKTHDKDSARAADSASKESTPAATPKMRTTKSDGTDSKSSSATTPKEAVTKISTVSSAKSKPSQEATVKKEVVTSSSSSSSSSTPSAELSRKSEEKAPKEKASGKYGWNLTPVKCLTLFQPTSVRDQHTFQAWESTSSEWTCYRSSWCVLRAEKASRVTGANH